MSPAPKVIGNFISEWFGHRMFPTVVSSVSSVADQRNLRCPFLSMATGEVRECIKNQSSKGVCTISSASNGPRQDWVVCPYRAFDRQLMQAVAAQFYGLNVEFHMFAAPVLASDERREQVLELLRQGEKVLVYFDQKMGGEIGVSATDKSPEIAFDTTFVELNRGENGIGLGRFAVMEIQTMDFHGSYRKAVENLSSALRLHDDTFPTQVQANQRWLGDHIEGPNIANVFKRTFWQMMFKFEMATSPGCAGVALTIPLSVWDSWQKFLGAPALVDLHDGTFALADSAGETETVGSSWIYVFDLDESSAQTPSPMRINRVIRTTAAALAHHALEEAPQGAIEQLQAGIYPALQARLRKYWPTNFEIPRQVGVAGTVVIKEDPRPVEEIVEDGG